MCQNWIQNSGPIVNAAYTIHGNSHKHTLCTLYAYICLHIEYNRTGDLHADIKQTNKLLNDQIYVKRDI